MHCAASFSRPARSLKWPANSLCVAMEIPKLLQCVNAAEISPLLVSSAAAWCMVALGLRLVPQRLAENANCRAKLRRPIARGDCPAPGALRPPSRTLSATVDKPQGSLFAGAARNRCGTVAAAASLRLYSNTYTGSARHVPRLVSARIVSPAKPEASQQHFSISPRHQVRTAWYFHFCSETP